MIITQDETHMLCLISIDIEIDCEYDTENNCDVYSNLNVTLLAKEAGNKQMLYLYFIYTALMYLYSKNDN